LVRVILILFCCLISINTKAQNFDYEKIGDNLQIALPVSAIASTFIWNDNQKAPLQFIKTMGSSFIITHSLKRIINKERPNGGDYSFPSGHTSAAFTGAAFIEKRYGLKAGIPAYMIASYVGWSRVYSKHHDYYDVVAGALLGIGSAYIFTKPFKNKIELTTESNQGIQTYGLRINL
jgi:membrane-associated phospholipid phosphatase